MRDSLSLLVAAVLASSALAADIANNEFRRRGGALVCITDQDQPNQEPPYLGCLRIGPLYIGQSERAADKLLGTPWKTIEKDRTTTIKVFPIDSDDPAKPYWVVTFTAGVVEAIQLTGKNPKTAYAFSSITLGDRKGKVLEVLGKPVAVQPVERINGTLWSYGPFPISLELVDERVYSIRVSRTSP